MPRRKDEGRLLVKTQAKVEKWNNPEADGKVVGVDPPDEVTDASDGGAEQWVDFATGEVVTDPEIIEKAERQARELQDDASS